jgi:flagellar L-ring protein precursor FlgH
MSPRLALLLLPALLAGGCTNMTRLAEIGRPPQMSPSGDPTREPGYRPMTMPMPSLQLAQPEANTLWRNGSRAFFKDQRAAQVGDILTVLVSVTDSANLKNDTTATRTNTGGLGLTNLFGLETVLPHLLPGAIASSLINSNGSNSNVGTGEIKRNENVTLRLAGVVTQVLANGNLVIAARQEVRVNAELREISVSGVIRPQDIASDNTVLHDRMAEARVSYGGRGQLTDMQTPKWGQQVLDQIQPF